MRGRWRRKTGIPVDVTVSTVWLIKPSIWLPEPGQNAAVLQMKVISSLPLN
jgi:hypothetical protein